MSLSKKELESRVAAFLKGEEFANDVFRQLGALGLTRDEGLALIAGLIHSLIYGVYVRTSDIGLQHPLICDEWVRAVFGMTNDALKGAGIPVEINVTVLRKGKA